MAALKDGTIRSKTSAGWPLLLGLMLLGQALPMTVVSSSTQQTSTSRPLSCLNGGPRATLPGNFAVAVVKPVFTATPYSQFEYGSFYAFFHKYRYTSGNITTDLGWLNTSVSSGMKFNAGWGHTFPLYTFLSSIAAQNCGISLGKNLMVISDINVTQGALFAPDGNRRFDAVVIGHEEYVTQAEYDQFRAFVASGGRLVAMSSNYFNAKVDFNPATLAETFVLGHHYAYNGRSAWHTNASAFSPGGWFGSAYCCFRTVTFQGATVNGSNPIGNALEHYFGRNLAPSYAPHEENAVSNFTRTSVVATFFNQSGLLIAAYVHHYGRGAVICLCVFGEDVISLDLSTQYFLVSSVTADIAGPGALTGPTPARPTGAAATILAVAVLGAAAIAGAVVVRRRASSRSAQRPSS